MDQQEQATLHHFTSMANQDPTTRSLLPSTRQGGLKQNTHAGCSNESGRERLKRHKSEVAGKVVIPDKWSQEEMLKEWLDCGSFDALLAPKGFDLARAALVAERKQAKETLGNSNKAYIGMHYTATRSFVARG